MRNLIILIVVFGIIGLVVGYLIFARREIGNDLIPLGELFGIGEDGLAGRAKEALSDLFYAQKRQNIYIAGGVGGVVGLVLGVATRRRR